MKTTTVKKARDLHDDSRHYRGHRRVKDFKTRANRIERRTVKQQVKHISQVEE